MRGNTRALGAVIATTIAVAGVTSLRMLSASSDEPQGKPPRPPMAEGTAGAQPTQARGTVPASGNASGCPATWRGFENPAARYRVCLPTGWAFGDLEQPEPLVMLDPASLWNLRLLSPEAFPWRAGDEIFDAILRRDVVDVELNVVPATPPVRVDDANVGPCMPRGRAGSPVSSCVERYDASGTRRDPDGPLHVLRAWFPLPDRPSPPGPDVAPIREARLSVTIRSTVERFDREEETLWTLLRSIAVS